MPHFFISYRRTDRPYAEKLKARLEAELTGAKGWIDYDDIDAGMWLEKIQNGIRECFAMVLVVTPNIQDSDWVMYEWIFAEGLGKTIIPAIFEWKKEWKGLEEIHERLPDLQACNFTDPNAEQWNELIKHLKKAYQEEVFSINVPFDAPRFFHNMKRQLEVGNIEECMAAINAVQDSNYDFARDFLAQIAKDHHLRTIRIKAALFHGARKDVDAPIWETLKQALEEGNEEICRPARAILSKFGGVTAVEILLNGKIRHNGEAESIIQALGRTKSINAINAIILIFKSHGNINSIVIPEAFKSLRKDIGNIKLREAEDEIINLLQGYVSQRFPIMVSLGMIGGDTSIATLHSFVFDIVQNNRLDRSDKLEAIKAILEIGTNQAVESATTISYLVMRNDPLLYGQMFDEIQKLKTSLTQK